MIQKTCFSLIIFTIYFLNYSISETPQNWKDPYDMHTESTDKWIDPHEMGPSKEYLKYTNNPSSFHKSLNSKKSEIPTTDNFNRLTELYYKRTINMLLNSVHEDNNEMDMYSGYLHFKISSENYERLKKFADYEDNDCDLTKIDKILEEILTKPSHQHIQEYLESWFHKFLNVALSRKGIIGIIILSYMFISYQMIKANFNLWYIGRFLLINIFIYDFIFTWIHLYQKTEIEYLANKLKFKEMPQECNPAAINSWHFLWNIFKKEDDCEKYFQVTYQDIFWKVSPGAVLTDMFARSIEQPAKSIGNSFAIICHSIYDKFPWPMNIIIFPVAMIFFCLMTMIILSVVFKRDLSFNFLHLFSFSNSSATEKNSGDRLTDKNVERLLRLAESSQNRKFIEEISEPLPVTTNVASIKQSDDFLAIKPVNTTEIKSQKEEGKECDIIEEKCINDQNKNLSNDGAGDC